MNEIKLEELLQQGWNKTGEFTGTITKGDYFITAGTLVLSDKTLRLYSVIVKDNINGTPISRTNEDKYRILFEGEDLTIEKLNELVK